MAFLDQCDRGLALANADNVLDVAGPLLPALDWLWVMGRRGCSWTIPIRILAARYRNAEGLDHCALVGGGHRLGGGLVADIERLAISFNRVAGAISDAGQREGDLQGNVEEQAMPVVVPLGL